MKLFDVAKALAEKAALREDKAEQAKKTSSASMVATTRASTQTTHLSPPQKTQGKKGKGG